MPATRLVALACAFLACASSALADPAPSVFIEDLTSPELAQRIQGGTTTVIVPIGGTEQNGAHMAIGKHNVRVRALSERVARALGNAVVAPVIAYVPESAGHMRYAGTIDVPSAVYRGVLEAAARSFRTSGFRNIVFLGDSGDYQKDNLAVASKLDREWAAGGVRVIAVLEYYRAATTGFADYLAKQGYAASEIGPHAGLADTSLMLAVDPRLVHADRMKPSAGVTGDPTHASATLGDAGVDAIVSQTVNAIRAATARH